MANPKKKKSNTRRNTRRSHLALKSPGLSKCDKCNGVKLPHRVCPHCGHYKGREVLQVGGY